MAAADGIYRSPRAPISFPTQPDLSAVSFLFRNASSNPSALALADADTAQSLTFSDLQSLVHAAASGLRRLGVTHRSVVLLLAPNSLRFPVSFLAVLSLGAVATTANPLYTVHELTKQAADSRPSLVITTAALLHKIAPLRLPTVLLDNDKMSTSATDLVTFDELISDPTPFTPPRILQTDTAALLYSSGTTGASKGVVLTHQNFICTAMMAAVDQERNGEPKNTFLCFLPMFHIFGLSVITYSQLCRGNAVVAMGRYEMEAVLRAIERYRVSYMFVVPPVMIELAKKGGGGRYDLSSLRFLGSGAAPLGKDVMEEVARNFPGVEVIQEGIYVYMKTVYQLTKG